MKLLKKSLNVLRAIFMELPRLGALLGLLRVEQFEIPEYAVEVLSNWKLREVEQYAEGCEAERAVVVLQEAASVLGHTRVHHKYNLSLVTCHGQASRSYCCRYQPAIYVDGGRSLKFELVVCLFLIYCVNFLTFWAIGPKKLSEGL